jgi:hypothetical protein
LTYDLGSPTNQWNAIHAVNMSADSTTFGSIELGITDGQTISTAAGDLILDSASNETIINDNLTVNGTTDITGATTLGDTLSVTGDATFNSNVIIPGLTPTHVVYVGGSNELVDNSNFTYDDTTQTVSITGDIQIDDVNINQNIISTPAGIELILDPEADAAGLGTVRIQGDLIVTGTTTTIQSTTVTIEDPIFTLGGETAPASDDALDRGIEFNWHDGVDPKVGYFGWDRDAQVFTFIPDATNTAEVFTGTPGDVAFGNGNFTGNVVPTADMTYNLGYVDPLEVDPPLQWNNVYTDKVEVATSGTLREEPIATEPYAIVMAIALG